MLSKYQGFSLGTALTAREPFTKNTRVKLENYIQDYGDRLEDNRVQPDDAPKKAAAVEPVPAATPAPKSEAAKPVSKEEAAAIQEPARTQ
ncbi:MAG: hypothetical protein IPK32_08925 [Verrucomicrobiaceae bacterium]|nr:hypothetical protein [Verrucomicrobiaceae bacterium]